QKGAPPVADAALHMRGAALPPTDLRGAVRRRRGILLVPASANARDPTTYVNHKVEEMCKAAKGIDTPLGKAVLAFHKRWG
uniref:hypothetical protein n=1 Tax=Bradyrhizobium japonicum TaxID=375 RepID=UPI001AEC925C